MEGAKISCASKLGSDHEESGWTAYLDDFQSSYSIDSPSLVSDAAWNGHNSNANHHLVFGSSSQLPLPKRLNFNNSNGKKFSCDDLEDTASSPVNSPKVSSLKPRNVNYRRSDDTIDQFLGKQNGSDDFSLQRTNDQRKEMNFGDGRNGECMEQKKMGFCLVPVAFLMNHLH